jgi:integrase
MTPMSTKEPRTTTVTMRWLYECGSRHSGRAIDSWSGGSRGWRNTIEVAETFSDGEFGTPKTRSSNRVIPMSSALRGMLNTHLAGAIRTAPDDLVFCTLKGTPLNSKNLYNRELAPACDGIKQPRVSWHSFRHTHATQLAELGESIKMAQALLGHSDLETTLNTYTHVIPESQRRAVDRVAGVLFSDVLNLPSIKEEKRVN